MSEYTTIAARGGVEETITPRRHAAARVVMAALTLARHATTPAHRFLAFRAESYAAHAMRDMRTAPAWAHLARELGSATLESPDNPRLQALYDAVVEVWEVTL